MKRYIRSSKTSEPVHAISVRFSSKGDGYINDKYKISPIVTDILETYGCKIIRETCYPRSHAYDDTIEYNVDFISNYLDITKVKGLENEIYSALNDVGYNTIVNLH